MSSKKDLLAFIEELIDLAKNMKRTDYSLETKFIAEAKKDLEACKILYERGIYSLAVYHLQQSVEKTAKAWVLFYGIVTEEDLKRIGHTTPRAFLEFYESKLGGMALALVEISKVNVSTNINGYVDLIQNRSLELVKMDYKGIKILMDTLRNIEKRIDEELDKYKSIINFFRVPLEFFEYPLAFTSLWVISSITFPHYEFTRYPGSTIEPSEYGANMGVVKALPELIAATKKCIDAVSKLLSI